MNNTLDSNQKKTVELAESNTNRLTRGKKGRYLMLPVSLSGFTCKVLMKGVDVIDSTSGAKLESKRLMGTTIQIINGQELKFINRCRDSIFAIFREHGHSLGASLYLVHESRIETVYRELAILKDQFFHDLKLFLSRYDDLVLEEKLLNPQISHLIDSYAPKKEKLERSCKLRVGSPQLVSVDIGNNEFVQMKHDIVGDEGEDNFLTETIESFSRDCTHFWRYSLQTARKALDSEGEARTSFIDPLNKRSGLRGTCIAILKGLRDKAQLLEDLHPGFENVVNYIDTAMRSIGGYDQPTFIKHLDTAKVIVDCATNLTSVEFIHSLTTSTADTELLKELEAEQQAATDSLVPDSPAIDSTEQPLSMDDLYSSNESTPIDIQADSGETETHSLEAAVEPEVQPKQTKKSFSMDDLFNFGETSTTATAETGELDNMSTQPVEADSAQTDSFSMDEFFEADAISVKAKTDSSFDPAGIEVLPEENPSNLERKEQLDTSSSTEEEVPVQALKEELVSFDDIFNF